MGPVRSVSFLASFAAMAWMRERRGPFFAYIHTLGAHRPYTPSRERWRPFLPARLPRTRDVNALVLQPLAASRQPHSQKRDAFAEGSVSIPARSTYTTADRAVPR